MRLRGPDIFFWCLIAGVISLIVWGCIVSVDRSAKEADRREALHLYAIKTNGHLESYKRGSHVESRYAGSYTVGTGKSATTISNYVPVVVEDYDERIVYFDGRPPYYPEDHNEWIPEYEKLQAERKR